MPVVDLSDWITEYSKPDFMWYVKRLAANDTLATNAHQAGPYIPKEFLFSVFPQLNRPDEKNPRVELDVYIDSHADYRRVTVIWYNNKLHGGTRNEARITNWGGSSSAMLDPESTGAIAAFVFVPAAGGVVTEAHVWVCNNPIEEDLIEDRIGAIEPGHWVVWSPEKTPPAELFAKPARTSCRLSLAEIPSAWLARFPSGADIIRKTVELRPLESELPDTRLTKRRECEYELFLSVEEAVEGPKIKAGFSTVDDFVNYALTVLQRRKSRAGRSLELHARKIFLEEGMAEGISFSHGPQSEPGKRPDFLFPSEAAYKDRSFPDARLRMLAAKTTCKDRWRQILNEADRISTKHLLTLQEGVSVSQHAEMENAGVQLVVPSPLLPKYPESIRQKLMTFEQFIGEVRHLSILS